MTDSKTATELLDGLRDVGNLHEFAELFGFDWYDESDWTWHDVAVKMADDFEQAIAATLGSGEAKQLLLRAFGLAQMMHDCWIEECKAGDNVDISACNAYSYEFDQVAQAMFDMGIDPNDSDYYKSDTLGSGECENVASHWGEFECSECGFYADFGSDLHRVKLCPDCGKAVKR